MYDYVDDYGVLVHKYGPHTFHTKKKHLFDYICKYGEWINFKLTCGAVIHGKCTPTPFNFKTIDDFLNLGEDQLAKEISSIGLYRNKAKNIIAMLKILKEKHDGKVPSTRDELEALPGVGRKVLMLF